MILYSFRRLNWLLDYQSIQLTKGCLKSNWSLTLATSITNLPNRLCLSSFIILLLIKLYYQLKHSKVITSTLVWYLKGMIVLILKPLFCLTKNKIILFWTFFQIHQSMFCYNNKLIMCFLIKPILKKTHRSAELKIPFFIPT